MVGHQDESGDKKAMPRPHLFQFLLEDLVAGSALEERLPSETTECDEMKMAGMLIADQAAGHGGEMVHFAPWDRKNKCENGLAFVAAHPSKRGMDGVPCFCGWVKGGPPASQVRRFVLIYGQVASWPAIRVVWSWPSGVRTTRLAGEFGVRWGTSVGVGWWIRLWGLVVRRGRAWGRVAPV